MMRPTRSRRWPAQGLLRQALGQQTPFFVPTVLLLLLLLLGGSVV